MQLLRSYIFAMRSYVTFQGRSTRRSLFGYLTILGAILGLAALFDGSSASGRIGTFFTVGVLVHLLPTIAISIRRVHDIDFPAGALLVGLIPYLGWIVLGIYAIAPTTPGTNKYNVVENAPPNTGTRAYAYLEILGGLVGRARRQLERLGGSGEAAPSALPPPPESLVIELGVDPKRLSKGAETTNEKRKRLETLRQNGMLSEAEYIRLVKSIS